MLSVESALNAITRGKLYGIKRAIPIARAVTRNTHPRVHFPEVGALDNEDEDTTQITWQDTTHENEPSPPAATPPPERRSRRQRKTSYADILPQSKYNG